MPQSTRNSVVAMLFVLVTFIICGEGMAETGHASWYALHSRTASGERCDPGAMTAAHRTLPFGTRVKVENLRNGKTVIVRINDRGPYARGRIIDLTRAAAHKIGLVATGTAKVRVTVLHRS